MTAKQRELYAAAREQIDHNLALLRPGLDFVEFNQRSWRIPEKYVPFRYTLAVHGTGMADEWPFVYLHPDFDPGYGGRFKQNMVVNVESLIAESGSESVKLETQVLITTDGAERLDIFPWEDSSHQLQWIQEGGTSTVTTPEASLRRRPRPTRTCRLREVRSLAVAVRAVGMTRSRAIGKRAPPDGRAEWTSRERPEMCPMLRRSFVSAAREF